MITTINEYRKVFESKYELLPLDKALELIKIFKTKELAEACTEEILNAYYDEGLRSDIDRQYWYDVQTELTKLYDNDNTSI